MGLLEDFLERGVVGWGVEDGLAGGAAIEQVVDDAAEIDGKLAGHGVGLAGKTRCLAISEPQPRIVRTGQTPVVQKAESAEGRAKVKNVGYGSRRWMSGQG
jgi:hypothetical protein